MAWQEVETDLGAAGVGRVKYSVALKHGGARVSVPAAIVARLKWTVDTRLTLLVGAGDLDGRLRLQPKEGGAIKPRNAVRGGGALIVRLGRWAQLAPRDVDAVKVDSEVHDDALTIRVPDHARIVQPAPRAVAAPTGRPELSIAQGDRDANGVLRDPATRRTVSVNDRFFNDPKRPPALASRTRKGGQA